MPRVQVDEKTLYDPLVIDFGDGRVYTSVPRSPVLLKKLDELGKRSKSGEISNNDFAPLFLELIFGVEAGTFDNTDISVLIKMSVLANEYVSPKQGPETAEKKPAPAESGDGSADSRPLPPSSPVPSVTEIS